MAEPGAGDLKPEWAEALHWLRCLKLPQDDWTVDDWAAAVMEICRYIEIYWRAWSGHPDFAWCQEHMPCPPWRPIVVGVFEHPESITGWTESYVVGHIEDIFCRHTQKHTARIWPGAKFALLRPVKPEWNLGGCWCRIGYQSHTYSKAYAGRMLLKDLLPKQLRPLVSKVRTYAGEAKSSALSPEESTAYAAAGRAYAALPEWYRKSTRAQLNYKHWSENMQDQDPERWAALPKHWSGTYWDFWLAATGKLAPAEIRGFMRQQRLFIDE